MYTWLSDALNPDALNSLQRLTTLLYFSKGAMDKNSMYPTFVGMLFEWEEDLWIERGPQQILNTHGACQLRVIINTTHIITSWILTVFPPSAV